jgi:hypothetical protein
MRRLVALAVASALVGAGASAFFLGYAHRRELRAESELASQAYRATMATYVLTLVKALTELRASDSAAAVATLQSRLQRDVEFLSLPSVDPEASPTVAKAIEAAKAYASENPGGQSAK